MLKIKRVLSIVFVMMVVLFLFGGFSISVRADEDIATNTDAEQKDEIEGEFENDIADIENNTECFDLGSEITNTYTPEASDNMGDHEYESHAHSAESFLSLTDKGFQRIEVYGKNIFIENYDKEKHFIDGKKIGLELPYYGGIYLGEEYNFVLCGQDNYEENDNKEVVRIIKYDKQWNRLKSVSIYGTLTVRPFEHSSTGMSEYDGILVIHTSHVIYKDEDELNHQTNWTIVVDSDQMKVIGNSFEGASWEDGTFCLAFLKNGYADGYVSHSFNQKVLIDDGEVILLDQGDAYPRALRICCHFAIKNRNVDFDSCNYRKKDLISIPGDLGDNDTGVEIGGFVKSNNGYIVVGTRNTSSTNYYSYKMERSRNIFLYICDKNFNNEELILTNYTEDGKKTALNPYIINVGNDKFAILWQEGNVIPCKGYDPWDYDKYGQLDDINSGIYYAIIDSKGNILKKAYIENGYLSDCEPIYSNNTILWYVTDQNVKLGKPVFYELSFNSKSNELKLNTFGVNCYEHQWNYGEIIKTENCTEYGSRKMSCSFCGEEKIEQIKPLGHAWDNGKVTKEPSTTDTGIKTYTCSRCGKKKNEVIDKLQEEKKLGICYSTHVQSYGWQESVKDGKLSGTVGESKRLEAIKINLENAPYSGDIEYRTHVQSYGWQSWVKNGNLAGTSGQAKRLEAIQIRLTGEMAKHYDVYYRVQAQTYGWLGWAKNGEYSGTAGFAKRLEAIQIVLVEKGTAVNGKTKVNNITLDALGEITGSTKQTPGSAYVAKQPDIQYRTHVQSFGWQSFVTNGAMSGTSGKAKRLEGIEIKLGSLPYAGGVRYTTHVQTYGWQGKENDPTTWKKDGAMAGTSGEAKRLEAIRIGLYGEMAEKYDIYYRVHAQSYGWLGWAKNGEAAGTAGYAKRLEGIQIVLVEKGKSAPGKTYNGITANRTEAYISK